MIIFQLLDADYFLKDGKPVVRLFGKTEENKPLCLFVDDFVPYFYIYPKRIEEKEKIIERLREIEKKSNIRIRGVKEVERFLPLGYHPQPEKMLLVELSNPKDVPFVREMIEKEDIVRGVYEADILFKYRFMVDHGLHGMDWIAADAKRIFTKLVNVPAYQLVGDMKIIEKRDNASLHYMSIDVECFTNDMTRPIDYDKDPLIMVSLAFKPEYRGKNNMVLVAKNINNDDRVKGFGNEKEMLEELLNIINEFDPDIITGYNILNFDIPYVLRRLQKYNIPAMFGRAGDKPVFCRTFGGVQDCVISGRVIVDPYQILRRDPYVRLHRYGLDTVAKELLGDSKLSVEHKEISALWNGNEHDLRRLIEYSKKDSLLALRLLLEKGLLDKFFELSKVSGLLLQDSLGGQSIRVETRILHDFKKKGFVMPSKPDNTELTRRSIERKKKELKGAFVLEPIKGLHCNGCTLVLDFLSLYPSIIRAYNVSPDCLILDKADKVKTIKSPTGAEFVDRSVREGVFSSILKQLMGTRARVKKEMRKARGYERKILDAKQYALKVMANSFYGYCGYLRARLYMLEVANSITAYGRNNILRTKRIIEENFPVKVLYMDTDSAFIKTDITDLDEASLLGSKIARFVTEKLNGDLILEFEKVYKSFLILTKKRYAGWQFVKEDGRWLDSIEMKGIETVRRDWCPLVSETMEDILTTILKEGDSGKAMERVKKVLQQIKDGQVPLEKLTVVKGITKGIDSYEGMLPHIELAKKLRKRNPQSPPIVGERIPFVIIRGNQLLSKRAEDPDYVRKKGLQIDPDYYINSQLLPPIERILNAVGITRSELLGNGRQVTINDVMNGSRQKLKRSEKLVLESWEEFVCKQCKKSYRRIPLTGRCDCGGELLIGYQGSVAEECLNR